MKKIEIRKTLFTRAAATGTAFIAIGSAGVMSLPAVAGAATTRPAVSQSTHKAETRIPPRRPSRIHPEILGPAISGEGGRAWFSSMAVRDTHQVAWYLRETGPALRGPPDIRMSTPTRAETSAATY